MVAQAYRRHTGKRVNLSNPQSFSDTIQAMRLMVFPRDPLVIQYSDPVTLRSILKEKKLSRYTLPLIGIFPSVNDIPWSTLPTQFIIRFRHAPTWTYGVFNHQKQPVKKVIRWIQSMQRRDYGTLSLRRHFSPIPHDIIVEPYLGFEGSQINTYQFNLIHGKIQWITVFSGQGDEHRMTAFHPDWTLWTPSLFPRAKGADYPLIKPEGFSLMVKIAESLGSAFPFIQIDFHEVKGKPILLRTSFIPVPTLWGMNDEANIHFGQLLNPSQP